MSRIIEEIVNNPTLQADYKKRPGYNLVKVQTITGSSYLGYIKDADEGGIWFEPLFDEFYPAYILKSDLKKIIIPTNPEEQKEIMKRERSWFSEGK